MRATGHWNWHCQSSIGGRSDRRMVVPEVVDESCARHRQADAPVRLIRPFIRSRGHAMKSQDPNECRVQAAKCIRKTSLCVEAKARDALYKMAKEWLELAWKLEREQPRQERSRLAALATLPEPPSHGPRASTELVTSPRLFPQGFASRAASTSRPSSVST
jgi:hypothetical protein